MENTITKNNTFYTIGVDEAGRGPLAGPVAIGIVLVPTHFDWAVLPGVGDSKKVSEKNRERIYTQAMQLAKSGQFWCTVEMGTAAAIDKRGIVSVIADCIDKGLKAIMSQMRPSVAWGEVQVLLDGSLIAPSYCVNQETIIKGDATEKVIGLASILAKVTRDRYMEKLAQQPTFKNYYFNQHKGYATAAHRRSIAAQGLSTEHRRTYCRNIKPVV